MKKKELRLDQLKVESFVTSLEYEKEDTIKGGAFTVWCPSDWDECDKTDLC
ncbi:pinensin family lanthipeptide [Xanthovirga aplysinae]|uniref:pinensin family lanthipeptide n=1 Tax=Xanthovirga aplysinae TaxID=2529853 RepID=UPI0012BD417B|nr:pinensin family lanthipeptide [Xanthovirga aplysinae]